LTETAGQIAAAFKQFFNIASPTSTMNTITTVTTATNLTNAATSGDLTATMKTSVTTAATAATPTAAAVTGAVGSVTAGVTVTTNNDKTGYALTSGERASIADALLTRQMTESYAANGVAPTPAQALFGMQQHLQMFAISGTSVTVKKLDGTTTAFVATLDSATTPTSSTRS
jgi:hypothetical protein